MLSKVNSHVEKLPVEQFSKMQKADDEGCCSTCCKVIAVVAALIISMALFAFMAPLPALVITACLLVGTGSLWVVPAVPVVSRGWTWNATPLSHRTIPVLPSRSPSFAAAPTIGGHTSFGGGHMRSAGFAAPTIRPTISVGGGRMGGGHVQFGRG